MSVGERIVSTRAKLNYSQKKLSELSKIEQAQLCKIETGYVKKPHPQTLGKIATALNVSFEFLMFG